MAGKVKIPRGEKVTIDHGKLRVPDNPIIAFIEGDGTGPDIWRAAVRVLDAAVEQTYEGKRRIAWAETYAGDKAKAVYGADCPPNLLPDETLDVIRRRVDAFKGRFVFGEFSEEEARCGAYLSPAEGLHSGYTFVMLLARKLEAGFVTDHYATLADYTDHWPTISFSNHDVPRTVSRFGGKDASPELAKMLFALLISLKGTTLIYQGEELGLPQASLSRDQLRDSGVRIKQIEIAGRCTVCDDNYFSYRREGVTGRFASVIGKLSADSFQP